MTIYRKPTEGEPTLKPAVSTTMKYQHQSIDEVTAVASLRVQ